MDLRYPGPYTTVSNFYGQPMTMSNQRETEESEALVAIQILFSTMTSESMHYYREVNNLQSQMARERHTQRQLRH
jgi:hypothetical protein